MLDCLSFIYFLICVYCHNLVVKVLNTEDAGLSLMLKATRYPSLSVNSSVTELYKCSLLHIELLEIESLSIVSLSTVVFL